jgi:16S rRNA (guanine1207-N2)-methyltransferase
MNETTSQILANEILLKLVITTLREIGSNPNHTKTIRRPYCRFLRARFNHQLLEISSLSELEVVQSWYPYYEQLVNYNLNVSPFPSQKAADVIGMMATRQKLETKLLLAQAISQLKDSNSKLLFVCPLKLGAKSYRDFLKKLGVSICYSSKAHCGIFEIALSSTINKELLTDTLSLSNPIQIEGTQLYSRVGIYGWNSIDRGSILLADNLPLDLQPHHLALLGSSYGYLASKLLERFKKIKTFEIFEAEKLSVETCYGNLVNKINEIDLKVHWLDATKLSLEQKFDTVITNPPLHDQDGENLQLGLKFIESCSRIVKPEGRVIIVTQTTATYEKTINKTIGKCKELYKNKNFKVLEAKAVSSA